jgi:hypothetical protein
VRAIAALKLDRIRTRSTTAGAASMADSERAHRNLLAADIKRFQERGMIDAMGGKIVPPSPAPPGAPIGDMGQDWLARPGFGRVQHDWDDITPEMWLFYQPPQ